MREQEPWVQANLEKAEEEQKANKKFLQRMQKGQKTKRLDAPFHKAHEEVFDKRDCLDCANCCRTTSPIFRDVDIERLSKHLGMKTTQFVDDYLKEDRDGDYVLTTAPCPFLGDDHKCSVYDHRPKACRDYPHTDRKNMYQVMDLAFANSLICPAVVDILEKLKG